METKAFIGEGLPVTIYFDYQPYEPPHYPRDQNGYPGCDASATINAVEVQTEGDTAAVDIVDALSAKCLAELETACLESINTH